MWNRFKILSLTCMLTLALQAQGQGKVRLERSFLNPDNPSENTRINSTICHLGNQTIQEVPHITFTSDSSGDKHEIFIKYYLFIDADKNQYLYFRNFSDTARVVMAFKGPGKMDRYGGWDIYADIKFAYTKSGKLTDTLVENVAYNRYIYTKSNGEFTNEFIMYANCNAKESKVKYLRTLSKEIGCPIFRMDTYFKGRLVSIAELKHVSDTLTEDEEKIFLAWTKKLKR